MGRWMSEVGTRATGGVLQVDFTSDIALEISYEYVDILAAQFASYDKGFTSCSSLDGKHI